MRRYWRLENGIFDSRRVEKRRKNKILNTKALRHEDAKEERKCNNAKTLEKSAPFRAGGQNKEKTKMRKYYHVPLLNSLSLEG
jgi:hypothetical protein